MCVQAISHYTFLYICMLDRLHFMHASRSQFLLMATLIVNLQFCIAQGSPGLTFGGLKNEMGYTVSLTDDGGYIVAGSTRSYGAGSWDNYVVKLNNEGSVIWSETYGWEHHENLRSVIQLHDGYLFVGSAWDYGYARLDFYLLKTNLSGEKMYDKFYGTHSLDLGFVIKPTNNTNGYFMLGYSRGYDELGDILLLKIDLDGNEIWQQNYGSDYDDYAFDFNEAPDGTVMIFGSAGSFYHDVHGNFRTPSADWMLIKTGQDGQELWTKTFQAEGNDLAQSIKSAINGGYYLFGSSQSYGAGSYDMVLMKVDDNGEEEWYKTYGGIDYEYGMSMDESTTGDLYLFGSTKSFGLEESPDYYLVKTDIDGEEIWSLIIGGHQIDYGNQVVSTNDGGCILVGQSKSFGSGEFDILIVKVSKEGNIENLIDGIDTSKIENFALYPNPARSNVYLETDSYTSDYKIQFISASGSEVNSYLLQPPEYHLNVETLSAGTYIYRITKPEQENFFITGKLIVR